MLQGDVYDDPPIKTPQYYLASNPSDYMNSVFARRKIDSTTHETLTKRAKQILTKYPTISNLDFLDKVVPVERGAESIIEALIIGHDLAPTIISDARRLDLEMAPHVDEFMTMFNTLNYLVPRTNNISSFGIVMLIELMKHKGITTIAPGVPIDRIRTYKKEIQPEYQMLINEYFDKGMFYLVGRQLTKREIAFAFYAKNMEHIKIDAKIKFVELEDWPHKSEPIYDTRTNPTMPTLESIYKL